jgi:chromosome segregation ATPase|uniref:Uncharacterized protein n=1 Tax=viral metagenome TaxID=1070528 RepID=A0A6C0IUQ7_9ZZZZ
MSTTKKVNAISDEYSELRDQFISNCQKSLENLTELNNIFVTVFNNTNSTDDITYIKEEWIKSSNKIDMLKDSIQTLQTEKNTIIKKIEIIINKKTKTTASDAKNITACQEEWCQVSSKMTILNEQLETYNKDRASIIKKAETYFSKLDSTKTKKSNKKTTNKDVDVDEEITITSKKGSTKKAVVDKEESVEMEEVDKKKVATKKNATSKKVTAVDKKVTAADKKVTAADKKVTAADKKIAAAEKKIAAADKKLATAASKKAKDVVVPTKVEKEAKVTKAKTVSEMIQNKLQLDSDSDSNTDSDSESDTDSNISSVDSGSDSDSDSDSSDDENDKE